MHRLRHYLHLLPHKELNELYLSIAIRSFGLSLIGIFIPIYLLKLGYTLAVVMLFYAMFHAAHLLFSVPSAKIAARFGFKHTILFSIPPLIIFYGLLHTLEIFRWPLFILAIIFGLSNALFWIGFNLDFSKLSNTKTRGREIGYEKIIMSTAHVLGPLIGGLILTFTSFALLFGLVSFILIVSAIPLLFTKDIHEPFKCPIKNIFKQQKAKDFFAFLGKGIETAAGTVIWPTFIFIYILKQYSSLGFVYSLSLVFSLLFMIFIGRLSDLYRKLILRIGAIFNTFVWGLRFFVRTITHIFIVDSLYGMSQTLVLIPFNALFFDKAVKDKKQRIKFVLFGEISNHIGKILLFLTMALIADLTKVFIFGGIASLLYILF